MAQKYESKNVSTSPIKDIETAASPKNLPTARIELYKLESSERNSSKGRAHTASWKPNEIGTCVNEPLPQVLSI
jgi:hypothetical protein